METVQANGLKFAYLAEGQGPLVLLVHGFPDTAHTWDQVRPAVAARGFRAVSPFTRGYSPTEIPPRDADAETLARDLLALIEALGETQAIVVGHDWGALAAYGAAALGPDRVKKLITMAVPHPLALEQSLANLWKLRHFVAYKLPGAARRFAAHDFAGLLEIYKRWSPEWDPPDTEFAAVRECYRDPAALAAAFGYYRALSFRPPRHLKSPIAVPTVTFVGESDPLMGADGYRAASRFFTQGYAVESMAGGHFLHREHPQLFIDKLLSHLSA